MEQMELETRSDADLAADGAVKGAVRAISEVYRCEMAIRSGYEAYGVVMEAKGRVTAIEKPLKKASEKMLETLDAGVETAASLAVIGHFVEQMAQEAILMAAKVRVCIDYLTNQARIQNVDPETGEIEEE